MATPFANKPLTIMIDDALHREKRAGRSRDAIAAEIGITGPNLSMWRSGGTHVPPERIEATAKVLNLNLRAAVEAGMASYDTSTWKAVGVAMRLRAAELFA